MKSVLLPVGTYQKSDPSLPGTKGNPAGVVLSRSGQVYSVAGDTVRTRRSGGGGGVGAGTESREHL